jgi:hypothetical protein
MDRLGIVLTFMTGSGLVTAVMVAGVYAWPPLLVAVALGMALAWPAARWISRAIKRRDPDWPDRTPPKRILPRPGDPEL